MYEIECCDCSIMTVTKLWTLLLIILMKNFIRFRSRSCSIVSEFDSKFNCSIYSNQIKLA